MSGAGNQLKTPQGKSLPQAIVNRITDALLLDGKQLPCHVVAVSGPIVTVQFDIDSIYNLPQVTMPLFGPEYIRYPIQVGDKGIALSADTMIGATSGLGVGTPTLARPGNLSALVFLPIGNKNWSEVDGNAVVIYGPNGVVMRDTGSGAVVTLTPTGIKCEVGSTVFEIKGTSITAYTTDYSVNCKTYTVAAEVSATTTSPSIVLDGGISQSNSLGGSTNATLIGPLQVTNDVTASGTSVHTHVHGGVQSGSSVTNPPV